MHNPYSAPNAVLSDASETDETYQPKLFAIHGRIGRIRYLAYSFLSGLMFTFLMGILAAALIPLLGGKHVSAVGMIVLTTLFYIPSFAMMFILAKRRLNDMDHSGWLSLLMLVPFVNFFFALYLIFGPGSPGTNTYGPQSVKNSILLVMGGLMIPMMAMIGILAALALPAYQNYVIRAKNAAAHAQH